MARSTKNETFTRYSGKSAAMGVSPSFAWTSSFGDEYQERNRSIWSSIKNRSRLFSDILEKMGDQYPKDTIIEVGGGCGDNLRAIDMIYERTRTPIKLLSCDPNETARLAMSDIATAIPGDLRQLPYNDGAADLVFTSGVLIHVPPCELEHAITEIFRVSRRWILSIEYFNPTAQEVEYRDHDGLMWRRDFGAAWLNAYPKLKHVANGFAWKHSTGLDNLTWWLFDKGAPA